MQQAQISTPSATTARVHHRAWLQVLFIGLAVYITSLAIFFFFSTGVNLFPTVMLLGNFLMPIVFVTFFYERRTQSNVSLGALLASAFWGGVGGIILASVIEHAVLRTGWLFPISNTNLSLPAAFAVGTIEELCKLTGVVLVARSWGHTSERDGIILGAAAGMGFAGLESSGYMFTTFVDVLKLNLQTTWSELFPLLITFFRGILSPFAHVAWTALLAGTLLRQANARSLSGIWRVVGMYLLVIVLHGLWDGGPGLVAAFGVTSLPVQSLVILGVFPLVGIVGLVLLWWHWHRAATS